MTKLRVLGLLVLAPTRGQKAKSVGSFGLLRMACIVLALCLVSAVAAPAQTFNTPASVSPAEKSARGCRASPQTLKVPSQRHWERATPATGFIPARKAFAEKIPGRRW
jgi:hypothetical protein